MGLKDWLKNGWLVEHAPSPEETRAHLDVVAGPAGLRAPRPEPRPEAGHRLRRGAPGRHRRPRRRGVPRLADAHHYRVIESLAHTLGLPAGEVRQLDAFRKKRNLCDYEVAGSVSDQEAAEAVAFAAELKGRVETWLQRKHPERMA